MPDNPKKNESKSRAAWCWALLGLAVALYVGSYVALSLQGRYEAFLWGVSGVKARAWIPNGFETKGNLNVGVFYAFYPLWYLDHRYWHTPDKAGSGLYPVNSDDYYMFPKPPPKTMPSANAN